jgi:hypothetical protein
VQQACEALGWSTFVRGTILATPDPRPLPRGRTLSKKETTFFAAIQGRRNHLNVSVWSDIESTVPMSFQEVTDLVVDDLLTVYDVHRIDGTISGLTEWEKKFVQSRSYVEGVAYGDDAKFRLALSLTELGRDSLNASRDEVMDTEAACPNCSERRMRLLWLSPSGTRVCCLACRTRYARPQPHPRAS